MSDSPTDPLRRQLGAFAPKVVSITEDVLFGDVWERPDLIKRDRSLITIAALTTNGSWEQLEGHLRLGRTNGLTQDEIVEALTHLAFYCGWPKALSALSIAQRVFSA